MPKNTRDIRVTIQTLILTEKSNKTQKNPLWCNSPYLFAGHERVRGVTVSRNHAIKIDIYLFTYLLA